MKDGFYKLLADLKPYLLGEKELAFYVAFFIFASIGLLIGLRFFALTRNKESDNTPRKFSFHFMLWDNLPNMGATMLTMYLLARFLPETDMGVASGIGFISSMGVVVLIGFAAKYIPGINKILSMNREVLKQDLPK